MRRTFTTTTVGITALVLAAGRTAAQKSVGKPAIERAREMLRGKVASAEAKSTRTA